MTITRTEEINPRLKTKDSFELSRLRTLILLVSAAMHETKETTPREATTETVSTKPYWCFSMGGEELETQRRSEEEGRKEAWRLLKV